MPLFNKRPDKWLLALLLCASAATQAQTAFKDNFTNGYDGAIWNARSGDNGTPFGCTFAPSMVSPSSQGITLNVSSNQCAELQTRGLYGYGRVEGSLKTGNTPGTVSSIFTYTSWWDTPGRAWQEIDIEFLPTRGNVVHTNVIYQPQNGAYQSWELDIGLDQYGVNIQNDLVKIGFDWSTSKIDWYLADASGNRRIIRTVTKSTNGQSGTNTIPANAWPTDPTRIMINHWRGDNSANALYFPGQYNGQTAWAYYDYLQYVPASGSSSSSSSSSPSAGVLRQAENYTVASGVELENTSDTGGGQNLGWIDSGDWMAYGGFNFPTAGAYKVEYRVASLYGGGSLSLDLDGGATQLGQISVPSTGGWQNWTTISQTVQMPAGTHQVGIYVPQGGWNLNWFKVTPM